MRTNSFLLTLSGAMLVASCHSSPPASTTPPEPSASEIAMRKQVQDSLDAVALASSDSLDRAHRSALMGRADSIEMARLAFEATRAAAEQAAAKNGLLRDELGMVVLFDVARSEISSEGRAALDRKVAILEANPYVRLQITGACDERGSESYNMALGERRTSAVRTYLIGKGVAAKRLDGMSSGETSPVDAGHDEAAWARNRRTEFAIVSGNALLAME